MAKVRLFENGQLYLRRVWLRGDFLQKSDGYQICLTFNNEMETYWLSGM